MKDYSKYIQSSYGFITDYKIVKNQIHVYTAATERNEPQIMDATKENIDYIEGRLANQYQMLINNRENIKTDYITRKRKFIMPAVGCLSTLFVGAGLVKLIFFASPFAVYAGLVSALCVLGGAVGALKLFEKKFDQEIDLIKEYFDKKSEIEQLSEKDKNLTEYLSYRGKKKVTENKTLKANKTIDNVFNVSLMDKISENDLSKLIERYRISVGLQTEQKFNKPKTRSRKKTNKKNK